MTALRYTAADLLFFVTLTIAGLCAVAVVWYHGIAQTIGPAPAYFFVAVCAAPALLGAAIGALFHKKVRGGIVGLGILLALTALSLLFFTPPRM